MTGRTRNPLRSFPFTFWIVIVFEFFERGSYYGVMSILSVYLTDKLGFPKEDVGVIKGTIQPLLYFLPILSGALADRFGYRRTLLAAFSLLGSGYFLASRATGYWAVFISLVIMGLGAGTFKPVISSSIARSTNENNSTFGFGIYYWSINLGAFLFPLALLGIGLWLILRDFERLPWPAPERVIGAALCYFNLLAWMHFIIFPANPDAALAVAPRRHGCGHLGAPRAAFLPPARGLRGFRRRDVGRGRVIS